jgi:hypothetical protein
MGGLQFLWEAESSPGAVLTRRSGYNSLMNPVAFRLRFALNQRSRSSTPPGNGDYQLTTSFYWEMR